jgi:dienelactone hydrolase
MMFKNLVFSLFLLGLVGGSVGCKHYDADLVVGDLPLGVSANNTKNYIHIYPTVADTAKSDLGLMFYPGGAVSPEAYTKMLGGVAKAGYEVCIVKMPLDLAVFDAKKGLNYLNSFDGVKRWVIAGHSLGGAMAGDVVEAEKEKFKGIIFLAAYPNKSINGVAIKSVSIYGSNDKVADVNKIKDEAKLPTNTQFVAIEGGNHAQFGSYGKQNSDGEATISEDEQHRQTQTAIINLLRSL